MRIKIAAICGLITVAVIAAFVSFHPNGAVRFSQDQAETEAILRAYALAELQTAFPRENVAALAAELRRKEGLRPSSTKMADAVPPCDLILSCGQDTQSANFEWRRPGTKLLDEHGEPVAARGGYVEVVRLWVLERKLNRALNALVASDLAKPPAFLSRDPVIAMSCMPFADVPETGGTGCTVPIIVGEIAFVRKTFVCGGLCGSTSLIAIERRDQKWTVVGEAVVALH